MPRYHIASKRIADAVVALPPLIPEIRRIIRKVDSINGPGVINEPESISILAPQQSPTPTAPPPAKASRSTTLVKVTGNATGGGKYTGVIWKQPTATTIPNAGNVSEAEIGQTGDAVLILNTAEVGRSTHDLTTGSPKVTIFPAHLSTAKSDDATPLPVYIVAAIDWEACV